MDNIFNDCFIETTDVSVPYQVWGCFGVQPDVVPELRPTGFIESDCSRWKDRWIPLPVREPCGATATAGARFGVRHILEVGANGQPIKKVASFPRMAEGRQYTVEIKYVELAPDRLQLRISGDIIIRVEAGERRHHIVFYDAAGPINRGFYRRGARHDFILTGISTFMQVEKPRAGRDRSPYAKSTVLNLGGRGDTYHARVEVTRTEMLHEPMLGQSAWRVRGIVSGDLDKPLELETLTTSLALASAAPPLAGETVRIDFWLIGELWNIGPEAVTAPLPVPGFDETVRRADDVEPPSLWWLFGDVDDEDYLDELKYQMIEACWPLPFSNEDALIPLILPLPMGEPIFQVRLGRGNAGCGVRTVLVPNVAERTMEVVSSHPIARARNAHLVALDRVDVSEDRLHGRVVGRWLASDTEGAADVPIAFYDVQWHHTRRITRAGDVCRYGLSIIAYHVAAAENHVTTMPTPAWMQELAAKGEPDFAAMADRETIDLDFSQLRMLIDMTDRNGRCDEYRFRGMVHKVRKLPDGVILEDAWELMVEVLEVDDEPIVLKVIASVRALDGGKPPRKGMFVEGSGWMQGELMALVRRGR
jgi:hypothetical protein